MSVACECFRLDSGTSGLDKPSRILCMEVLLVIVVQIVHGQVLAE